jgi:signal transduction histidine kinase
MITHLKSSYILYFFLITAAPSPQFLYAAIEKADSLKQSIISNPDTRLAADNLLALAESYRSEFILDSAAKYANQCLALSTDLKYQEGIAESNYKLHLVELHRGNLQGALGYVIIFNKICEEAGYETRLGKGYYSYGVILGDLGEVDSSLYYIRKSLEINMKMNDTLRLIATHNAIGNIYFVISEYDSAAHYYIQSIQLAELSGRLNYLGPIYNNLGSIFTKMNEYDRSRSYLEKALEINKKNGDSGALAQTFARLGDNSVSTGDIDKAKSYYEQAMLLYDSVGNFIGQADILNNIANIYRIESKFKEALESYEKAYEFYNQQGYIEGITVTLMNMGQVYSGMGKYELALVYLDSCLLIATKSGYLHNRSSILLLLSENYYKAGEYKKAYEYNNLHYILADSLLGIEKSKALNELEKKYQKEKDQARILNLEKENLSKTIQRNVVVFSAIGLVMLALFIVLYFSQRSKKDRIIAQQRIVQLEEEKKLMTARLLVEGQEEERKRIARELHDGLGVLLSATKMQFTTIKDKSPENQPMIDKATQLLEQASGDVRRISHNMMPGSLTKLGFYDAVEDLIDNIRDIDGMNAVCEIEGDQARLPENKEIMLYRVVQEMVNNTLKHAGAKNVSLKILRSASGLEINFSDDGVGFNTEKALNDIATSFGLKSIRSRIGFLNGEVTIDSAIGKGTRYKILVPV